MSPAYSAERLPLDATLPNASLSVLESIIQALQDTPLPVNEQSKQSEGGVSLDVCGCLCHAETGSTQTLNSTATGDRTASYVRSCSSVSGGGGGVGQQQQRRHFSLRGAHETNDEKQPRLDPMSSDTKTSPSLEISKSLRSLSTNKLLDSFDTRNDENQLSSEATTTTTVSMANALLQCILPAESHDADEVGWLGQNITEVQTKDVDDDALLSQLCSHILTICRESFGSAFIQRLLEKGSEKQVVTFCESLIPAMVLIALDTYGCRVIQKALEVAPPALATRLAHQLRGHVIQCIRDPNGNHVVQKCIEVLSFEEQSFILRETDGKVSILALHSFGCRILQRLLERWPWASLRVYFEELIPSVPFLVADRFGNYVVQHLLEYGDAACKSDIVAELVKDLPLFGHHKFASNVIEKALTCCSADQCSTLISAALASTAGIKSQPLLLAMSCDRYGNYVVQRMLQVAQPEEAAAILAILVPHLDFLKRVFCGRYIATVLEQYMHVTSFPASSTETLPPPQRQACQLPSSYGRLDFLADVNSSDGHRSRKRKGRGGAQ